MGSYHYMNLLGTGHASDAACVTWFPGFPLYSSPYIIAAVGVERFYSSLIAQEIALEALQRIMPVLRAIFRGATCLFEFTIFS
jgi:hypothetical protein